ncbi:sodium:calcium antiporter [Virgibacillus halodenitrificans]|uniref:sodium:calcium antiporter n=1 Tax=Virgibacillus halodenitrificans TaxID=1482 RepID=UPI0024C0BB4B|nr:sodium:calcium antiporter [Virgibacillus halodenitrificans]WHX28182.1 sodium:calcium antiporter [Virgibacillus halodenitrificans]
MAAFISAYSAIKLSTYADKISRETKLGGMMAGTILLAVATSLPELTVSISASIIGNVNIAVGNGFGSILFNFFALFGLDLIFRKKQLFLHGAKHHVSTGYLALLLSIITMFGLFTNDSFSIFHIGLASLLIIAAYVIGLILISSIQKKEENSEISDQTATSIKGISKTLIKFFLFSIVILVSGSALSLSGDRLAAETGLSATFIGSILVAMASSIPDTLSVFTALKLANINMAVGTILGSNLFNILVIAISDPFYQNGTLWKQANDQLIILSVIGFLLTIVTMLVTKRNVTRNPFTYMIPSLTVVISYLGVVVYIVLG